MREHLKDHIDLLFRGAENCEEIKQEILQNTLDRYDDLIAQGKSPEAAYQLAISGIGDVSELLHEPATPTPPPPKSQQPVNAAQQVEKPIWKRILFVIAIFLYIVAAIPLVVLSSMNMEAIGLCGTLAIAAIATPLMILACSGSKANSTEKSESQDTKGGSVLWIVGTILYLLISIATGAWHITWIIFCILPCLSAITDNARNFESDKAKAILKIVLWSLLVLILVGILIAGLVGDGITVGYSEFGGLPGGTEASSGEADAQIIRNIDIRWVGGEIILRRDPAAQSITFCEERGSYEKPMAYTINGETLTIAFVKESTWQFGISSGTQDKTLIVTIPAFWGSKKITINSISAEVDVKDMLGEKLDLITVSGDVTVSGSGFNSVKIEAVSGDVEYAGSFLDFSCESVSGDCKITTNTACEEIEMESVSGELKLWLPETMGFRLDHESVSGDIFTDIPLTPTRGSSTYGNGECSISLETVSGDIHIDHVK